VLKNENQLQLHLVLKDVLETRKNEREKNF